MILSVLVEEIFFGKHDFLYENARYAFFILVSIIIFWMSEEFELSEREIDIIRLVATGASNKEIAHTLVISPNTVKVHLRNIFAKLNVVSRTEATMVAISRGWVESPKNENSAGGLDESATYAEVVPDAAMIESNPSRSRILLAGGFLLLLVIVILIWNNARLNRLAAQTNAINQSEAANQRWQVLSPITSGLKEMAALRYEKYFYLFGGVDSGGTIAAVNVYNIEEDSWTQKNAKPIAVSNIQAAVLSENIYIPGGINADNEVIADLEVYDPREDRWEKRSNLPHAISRYGLIAFEGKLYLFGGWDGLVFSDEVWVYDPTQDAWEIFDQLPEPTADLAVTVVGGAMHLFGGFNEKGALDTHYLYFPQRKVNGENAWEAARALPQARYGMGISVLADMVYIAGGTNAEGVILPIIQYLPPRDEWMEIDQPSEQVGAYPAVLPYETRLYVIGGESDKTITGSNQVYQAVYTILVPVIR